MSIPIVHVPNIKAGDVFYVVNQNKFLAVRVKNPYIVLSQQNDCRDIVCDLEFPKGINIQFGKSNKCRISYERGDYFSFKANLYDTIFTCFYKTLEDAKRGIKFSESVNLYALHCFTKGFESIQFGCDGISTRQWDYNRETLTPTIVNKIFRKVELYEDGYRLLKDDLTPEPNCSFKSEEEVVTFLERRKNEMEVVDFDDEPKKEDKKTISVEITKNTTALELAEKIIAESKGMWK